MRKKKEKEKALNLEAEVFKRSELSGKYTAKICLDGTIGSLKTNI